MKNLQFKKTKITPEVTLNQNGQFKIDGRSIPEDPENFYNPLLDWLTKYFNTPSSQTILDIQLEYINSGSSKFILALLRLFKENHEKGNKTIINWIYEEDDENVYELGIHYKSILNIPVNMVEII